jgi:PPM family protein phosphatase
MALQVVEKASLTDVGRQRQSNEDSYLERAPLFAVADGMGGARAGEVASRIAVEAFDHQDESAKPEERLAGVAREANRRIYERAQSDTAHAGMGTTLTAVMVSGRDVAVSHVGDSRLYRLRDGGLARLTEDHSLVEELVRQGRLSPEEAENHPQRSIITRALGPEPDVDVETFTDPGRAGDVYLLCSDGLSAMVTEEEIAAILESRSSLDDAARKLVQAANDNGGKDNITVVLFRLGGDGEAAEGAGDSEDTGEQGTVALSAEEADRERAEAAAAAGTMALGREEADRARAADQQAPRRRVRVVPARVAERRYARPSRWRAARRGVTGAVVLIAVAAAVVGLYAGSRQFYFLGTDSRGVMTLYRGLPYDLPLGIHLYTKEYASDVPAASITNARERRALLDHTLRSRSEAVSRLRALERSETPR